MGETKTKAEEMAEENGLDVAINQAYIDNIGEQYAKAEDVAEAYQGQYNSDEDFAKQLADDLGEIDFKNLPWPQYCIDWEYAAREIMMDYFEMNGYYFRSI